MSDKAQRFFTRKICAECGDITDEDCGDKYCECEGELHYMNTALGKQIYQEYYYKEFNIDI